MASFTLIAAALQLVVPVRRFRAAALMGLCTLYSRVALRVLNVEVHATLPSSLEQRRLVGFDGRLFLPNHVSYLDVMLIHSVFPAAFVTSREIYETPVLGWLTRAAGCLFVERRRRVAVGKDLDDLSTHLNSSRNLVLFPEGSTSPGDRLLPFKSSLLEAAARSRCRVHPVVLQYESIDGEPFGPANRDNVAWYGPMTFLPHLIRLASTRSVVARVTCLDAVEWRAHGSRKRLSETVKARIAARLAWDT